MSRAEKDEQEELLVEVQRAVARWPGWSIRRTYEDDYGRYAFLATYGGVGFVVVAKRRAHEGLASFMRTVVHRALRSNYYLVEFFGTRPTLDTAYAFRPDTVLHEGRASEGYSRKKVNTEWLELSRGKWGVLLGDFITRNAEPPASQLAGNRQTSVEEFA